VVKLAKLISIINFKGGVGKTTVALHLATGLVRYHDSRVLLIDVDHQSSLSLVCLSDAQWSDASNDGKTVNSIFQHYTQAGTPLPGKDIILKHPMSSYSKLDLLPAELQLDETELDLGFSGIGGAITAEWEKRMLLAKWIEKNNVSEDYDYIIFDCPPATKIVTQNAIAVSHGYFIPTIPDSVSIRGINHLIERMFEKIDEKMSGLAKYLESTGRKIIKSYVQNTKFLGIIIFRIKPHGPAISGYVSDHTTHLRRLERDFSKDVLYPYIEEGVGVTEAMSSRRPVYDCIYNKNVIDRNYINVFKQITEVCKKRIDSI